MPPLELLDFHQWLVWRYEKPRKGDKPTKVPYSPHTKQKSAVNNPESWGSYDDAVNASEGFSGIGFAFAPDDPFVGVDLDNCRDKATGDIATWAWVIIGLFSSYTEISPSGTGVHILVQGQAPHCGKTKLPGSEGAIEMYDRDRYFTVSGNHLDGTPETIQARQNELETLFADYFGHSPAPNKKDSESHLNAPGDVVAIIRNSQQRDKFDRLMAGDTSDYSRPDNDGWSEADSALCAMLAFYTKDTAEIERIWSQSQLAQRGKFARADYREMTIRRALDLVGDAQYTPGKYALPLTDMGNAERLIKRHGQNIRFCFAWDKWLIWDARRWKIDDSGEIFRLAKDTVKSIFNEAAQAEDEASKDIGKHAIKSQAAARVVAMIELAKSDVPVAVDDLDAAPWLLNVRNGTLDLRNGTIRRANRDDFITKLANVTYDASAQCPQWGQFVTWAMCGDAELLAYLQKALGYGMTGDCSEHAIFIPYGAGKNGKSTLFGAIQHILGDYADSMRSDSLMVRRGGSDIPNDIAALKGQRFIVSSEGEEGQRLAEALVKSITGGDMVKARFLRAEYFTFKPTHKIFFFTNKKPVIRGTDEGIWRRIHLIPFDAVVTNKDKRLPEKLLVESSGILNWLIAGCLAWQRDGLGMPPRVESATNAYRDEMDVLQGFISDHCTIHPSAKIKATELYELYKQWCDDNGEYPQKQRFFGSALRERGLENFKSTGGYTVWRGIKIKEESDTESETAQELIVDDSGPGSSITLHESIYNSAMSDLGQPLSTVNSEKSAEKNDLAFAHCEYFLGKPCKKPVVNTIDDVPLCAEHHAKVQKAQGGP